MWKASELQSKGPDAKGALRLFGFDTGFVLRPKNQLRKLTWYIDLVLLWSTFIPLLVIIC